MTREGTCLNCDAPVAGDFCSVCGQDNRQRRLTARRVLRQTLEEVLDFEQPLLRTILHLSWRPGWVAREYVRGRRGAFTNPLKYCLVMATLTVVLMNILGLDVVEMQPQAMPTSDDAAAQAMIDAVVQVSRLFMEYIGIMIALTLPLLAVSMRLLLWRGRDNIVEHYVLALYAYGQIFLIQALMIPPGLYAAPVLGTIYGLMPIIWYTLAAMQFCEGRRWYILVMSIVAHAVYFVVLAAGLGLAAMLYVTWNAM